MDTLVQKGDRNIRSALAQVLAVFVKSEDRRRFHSIHFRCAVDDLSPGKLSEQVCRKLVSMALDDRDYNVRSKSVNTLAAIVANEGKSKCL